MSLGQIPITPPNLDFAYTGAKLDAEADPALDTDGFPFQGRKVITVNVTPSATLVDITIQMWGFSQQDVWHLIVSAIASRVILVAPMENVAWPFEFPKDNYQRLHVQVVRAKNAAGGADSASAIDITAE